MTKYTQKQLKAMVNDGIATDVSYANYDTKHKIEKEEGWLTQIGYSSGVYGCSGMLLKSQSGKLYAITGRTQAIYIF